MTIGTGNAQLELARGGDAPAPRTLFDVLAATAATHPDATALEDPAGSVDYAALLDLVRAQADDLARRGVRRGDRVGVRIPSGGRDLYLSILAVLAAGAAYVPVDADDPEERATLVFGEAGVVGVIGAGGVLRDRNGTELPVTDPAASAELPRETDDAWIIFTSGSTGVPKGVAVTHRSAAAFVDAEARMFLQAAPIGPGDRVLAGLSVAFDASCEEMWLAWGHGAALVPAPRSLVRTGVDLGPWLIAHTITVVSTVPTLAALWPDDALEQVRLVIFGGEACPPELAARIASRDREVWNTYGPTEATVVACGSLLDGSQPIRIGLPLDGWDLAVVDGAGQRVEPGGVGELVIGGVGLGRYLDPAKDAEKYAPFPELGWERAYRSGDLVRYEPEGLVFQGRADDQVKLGGRRIELGEIDAALQALDDVAGGAAVVQRTPAGNQVLVGYVAPVAGATVDVAAANARLRQELPAALVPLVAVVESLPTRTSGKVDRAALPWPLPGASDAAMLPDTVAWIAERWSAILGVPVASVDDDFFAHGGGSLTAAQLVSAIRERFPTTTVADVYDHPRIGALAAALDESGPVEASSRDVTPVPPATGLLMTLLGLPVQVLRGLRVLTWTALVAAVLHATTLPFLPVLPWPVLVLALLVFVTPIGKMALTVVLARLLLAGVRPGSYPRGGSVHLRVWLAERIAEAVDGPSTAGAPWISYYARALGARIGRDVDLHTLPPVTGMLTIGKRASIEPEVDLAGHWLDGDVFHLGHVRVDEDAVVRSRTTLLPGAHVGAGAEITAGSAVGGPVPAGERWAGAPAERTGSARDDREARPATRRRWLLAYGAGSLAVAGLPVVGVAVGLLVAFALVGRASTLGDALLRALVTVPLATVVAGAVYALLVVVAVRLLGIGLHEGRHPVRSRIGWQVWSTERVLDAARTLLFPLYASLVTPVWLRLLGARVGRDTEISTVLLIPALTQIASGAFLADDTMVATYELGGGRVRIGRSKVGRRAFLGNSGMTGAGRSVPREALVAVLSAVPKKAKRGSSWLGSPPVRLRRAATEFDEARTFRPSRRLKVARGCWELLRLVAPMVSAAIALGVAGALLALWSAVGIGWTVLLAGPVLIAAGAVAAVVSTIAKWAFVGRITAREHPLWSSFVWRNEVQDTFVETVARPWFAEQATGTPALAVWLRSLGATIGRGTWLETYWLPEADLVTIGSGASVARGTVVQTHLFHDRVMQLDTVRIDAGATLGPHSVVLPAAGIGAGATVGPSSLVMRGEQVPTGSRWSGNPIAPWTSAAPSVTAPPAP
ncbi:amino acid adenylation domain-containing protein [Curtobacterium flaccumfaciens pv. betae]|uniref:Pls/PosA family non-ribosomal peptide synthetase n=1 Tax=Curtobacterium flaccumfaciens TaxID=2035 RepID=UPI001BDE36BB|nr:Pls/PosA family non-ribosomal peptide synthetase [Curtobacterium flaccumfaciens]MBT1607788.1 amino acid adenylation domain-containing protein [Curtobacterium flaccumfaciens pv. betae]MCS5468357.1 amino acid adenylation domain-containing protein [Curtobacterium flaccumfaciens pv. betae]MCX2872147.1 amino acid adenylation domain-containing protein [Curtobacterium flaccumfaciens pv. betae]